MKALLADLERKHPTLRQTMLAAIGNVVPSHLYGRADNSATRRHIRGTPPIEAPLIADLLAARYRSRALPAGEVPVERLRARISRRGWARGKASLPGLLAIPGRGVTLRRSRPRSPFVVPLVPAPAVVPVAFLVVRGVSGRASAISSTSCIVRTGRTDSLSVHVLGHLGQLGARWRPG